MSFLANLLLLTAWVGTHHGVLAWLGAQYTRGDRRLEALLAAAIIVMAWRRLGGPAPLLRRLGQPAAVAWPALVVLAACVGAEGLLARWLDLHLLRASAFVIGSYAIAGLYLPRAAWRAAFPWVGLLTLTLPFGAFSDIYLGFPARVFTAELVAAGLESFGIANLSRDTILVFDRPGGPATFQVDVPCAGVRSLWSATVFLLAAAGVEGRRLDRWFGAALLTTGVAILAANTLRVGALVVIGEVLRAPALAAGVHVPLGLVGFAWAVAAGWCLLRQGGPARALPETGVPVKMSPSRWPIAPLLIAGLALSTWLSPAALAAPEPLTLAVSLPAALGATPLAPVPAELRFFTGVGVAPPQKWRFTAASPDEAAGATSLTGTLLAVPSRVWRAHHQPEACLLAAGHLVEAPGTVSLGPEFPLRLARVDGGGATAVWWFQSPTRVTEDLAVRTWAALSGAEDRWVLVSLLLDGAVSPADPALRTLLTSIHAAVDAGLGGSEPSPGEATCAPFAPC